MVEGVGFEPTHRILYGGRFSKPLPSATQPTFLILCSWEASNLHGILDYIPIRPAGTVK